MNNRTPACNALIKVARWLLGGAFVYMGWNKALHPVDFLKLVQQYEFFHNYLLLNAIAVVLPWFEIFCGFMLLAGIAVRGTALILVLMLVSFTGLVFDRALNLATLKAMPFCAVKFDCGCGSGEILICYKLVENFCLIILSACLLVNGCKTMRAHKNG